jgi:hypothetical protein
MLKCCLRRALAAADGTAGARPLQLQLQLLLRQRRSCDVGGFAARMPQVLLPAVVVLTTLPRPVQSTPAAAARQLLASNGAILLTLEPPRGIPAKLASAVGVGGPATIHAAAADSAAAFSPTESFGCCSNKRSVLPGIDAVSVSLHGTLAVRRNRVGCCGTMGSCTLAVLPSPRVLAPQLPLLRCALRLLVPNVVEETCAAASYSSYAAAAELRRSA